MKKRKLKIERLVILFVVVIGAFFFIHSLFNSPATKETSKLKMVDLSNKSIKEIEEYAKDNNLKLDFKYEYNKTITKDKVIDQSIKKDKELKKNDNIVITISKGKIGEEEYKNLSVNELGEIPVMMYHGIENIETTNYIGGNVDKDGYNRTVTAFKEDLEFYYKEGYQMIRLIDYVNGNINTDLGKSPIVLTFDDGNQNNFNVTGKDAKGNLIIDPNCAIGILESFKNKYPDFNVTATFFLMDGLFFQNEYDNEKLNWLVDNGYDVGNHTKSHVNYRTASTSTSQNETGYMYDKFEAIIPGKYVNIVALPFGSPGDKNHSNFKYVLNGTYNNKEYTTLSTLRVGWMPELSPFHKDFDKTFIKRVRAYNNNGKEFDIEMVFNNLKTTKYISDGDKDTVVIPKELDNKIVNTDKEIIKY